MNEQTNVNVGYVSPLKRMCMTIGELPASYLETMTYYEMLLWFTKYLKETLIPTINNNAEAVKELQNLYEELRSYVNNYFDNLDVQEEIDNKLEEMADSGQLTDIIAQYLGLAGMITFDTVADMKLAENLVNGSKCKTLGFYSVNDGGGAFYKIRTITNDDVVNEMDIIEVYDDSLIAELIIENNTINLRQVGCSPSLTDNSNIINTMILKHCNTDYNNKDFLLPNGTYDITSTIELIRGRFTFDGDNSIINQKTDNIPIIEFIYPSSPLYTNKVTLKNIQLNFENQQNQTNAYGIKFDHMVYNSNFENISIYKSYIGIGCVSTIDESLWKISWKQILINNFYYRGFDLLSNAGAPQNYFENIYFQCGGITINGGCCFYATNLQAVIDNIEVNTNTNGCELMDLTSSTVKIGNFTLEDMTLVDKRMFKIAASTVEFNNMYLTKYKGTFGENTAVFENFKSFIYINALKIVKDTSVVSGNLTIVRNTNADINKTIIKNIGSGQNGRVSDYTLTAGIGMSLVKVEKDLPTSVSSLSSNTKLYGDLSIAKLDADVTITFDNTTITGGFEYNLTVVDFNSHSITLTVPYYNGAFVTTNFTLTGTGYTDYKIRFIGRPYKMGCVLYKNGAYENSIWI